MSSAYEKVADTRPRIRRDVLFTRTPDGVLFHNASSGFRVTAQTGYRLASVLVPHLNGANRVADICGGLPETQRSMIGELISALYARDFVRDVPPLSADTDLSPAVRARFAAQISYVDHYTDRAPERFADFRAATFAVLGDGPIATACVTGLVRNGSGRIIVQPDGTAHTAAVAEAAKVADCAPDITVLTGSDELTSDELTSNGLTSNELTWSDLAGADVVLVAGGDDAARATYRLLASGIPAGKALLPAWVFGERAIIGPVMGAEHAGEGCWCCAMLRLGANGDAKAATAIWAAAALPAGAVPVGRAIGRPLAAMIGNLLAYEGFRLTTGALPAETAGKVIVQNLESLDVISEPLQVHPRCPFCIGAAPDLDLGELGLDTPVGEKDADAYVAELNERIPLIQPHVGVFTQYDDEHWTQTPIKVGTVAFTDATGTERKAHAFDVHHVAGARRRAMFDAAVSYTGHMATVEAAATDVPRAGRLITSVGTAEVEHGGWTLAASLLDGAVAAVPVAAVEPFGPANRAHAVEPTRAGGGAGATAVEAVTNALASALAYAAVTGATNGTASVTRVRLDTIGDDPELTFLIKSAANLGVAVELLALAGPLPVLVARHLDACGAWRMAVSADPAWHTAAVRALCDLLGRVQIGQQTGSAHGSIDADGSIDAGDAFLTDFDAGTLVPSVDVDAPVAEDTTTWAAVLDTLRADGTDVLVTQTGGADLAAGGIVAVRVLLTNGPRQ